MNEELVESFRAQVKRLQTALDVERGLRGHFELLAQERAEEVAGRGEDLRALELGTHALVRVLWPGREGEELLESDIAGETAQLFARMAARVCGLMEAAAGVVGAVPPVDHARETLAQLEGSCRAGPPSSGATPTAGAPVAGRVCVLLELARAREHAQDERDTRDVLEHGAVSVKPLEQLLARWYEARQARFLGKERREVLTICSDELAQVIVEHAPAPAAALLGGMGPLLPLTTREG